MASQVFASGNSISEAESLEEPISDAESDRDTVWKVTKSQRTGKKKYEKKRGDRTDRINSLAGAFFGFSKR
jgi:hypothetical protein